MTEYVNFRFMASEFCPITIFLLSGWLQEKEKQYKMK